jgi:hypothetical protein
LWNGRIKNTIYTSTYVPKASIEESIKRYPNSSPLYFTKDEHFAIGDGRYNVSAIARHYDRLLIFTEGEAWMADSASCATDEFPVMTINSNIGCTAPEGALCANNTPITLSKNGIYRWTSDTDELNDCNAFCISEPISPLLSKDVFKNGILHFDRESNELWVHEGAESDVVWIYNFTYKRWSRYSGISAAHIFDVNGSVGFSDAHSIYVFDDSLSTDSNDSLYGNINASFCSGIVDFDGSDYKRIKTLTYRGDLNIPDGNIILSTDRGETIALALSGLAKHNVAKKRVSSHRLKSFSISLNENSQNEQTFHLFEIELK